MTETTGQRGIESAEAFAKRFWHDVAPRRDLNDYGPELILERDASIRAPLEAVMEEIRRDPKTYHRWTTNQFDGERKMVGCNYCPASAEGQIPINHHRMCVLNPDREQAFEAERVRRAVKSLQDDQPA